MISVPATVAIRPATAADAAALRRLAALDSAACPTGPMLIAAAGGRIVAAVSLETAVVVADPFERTAELVALLRLRAAQLASSERGEPTSSARGHRPWPPRPIAARAA
jgi:hypothetical protein